VTRCLEAGIVARSEAMGANLEGRLNIDVVPVEPVITVTMYVLAG
jgi:hypothetical protein